MERTPTPAEQHYLALRARMARLVAAEDRAFARFMAGTGPRATVRAAASRVNRLSPELAQAEGGLYDYAGRLPGDAGYAGPEGAE